MEVEEILKIIRKSVEYMNFRISNNNIKEGGDQKIDMSLFLFVLQ